MGGGKKRKSVNKSSGAEQNADTNKRIVHSNGNDSDYGVFSDPDEASDDKQPQSPQSPQSPTSPHSHIVELSLTKANIEDVIIQEEDTDNTDNKVSSEELTKSTIILDKSLDTLKMKLEKDPVYSNKTTLTSFFSYIILAMEIDIACSSTITTVESTAASAFNSSNAERLIEYIIRNHSSTPEVEQFTLTMLQLGVITHIINGVIEFNRTARASTSSSNHSHTLQTLQSLEQLHLNHKNIGETDIIATSPSSDLAEAAAKQPNCFIRFWRNMSLCCCKCRKSRKESILENNSNDSNDSNDVHKSNEDATTMTKQPSTKKSEEDVAITQSNTGEEMKELTI